MNDNTILMLFGQPVLFGHLTMDPSTVITVTTVFIQIDAYALNDTHSLHHQAPDRQKWVKLMIFV